MRGGLADGEGVERVVRAEPLRVAQRDRVAQPVLELRGPVYPGARVGGAVGREIVVTGRRDAALVGRAGLAAFGRGPLGQLVHPDAGRGVRAALRARIVSRL